LTWKIYFWINRTNRTLEKSMPSRIKPERKSRTGLVVLPAEKGQLWRRKIKDLPKKNVNSKNRNRIRL
jgi:hypothetical protein